MTFRMFVGAQLRRLTQFRDFATLPEPASQDLTDWVATASAFPADDKRDLPVPEWIANHEPAKRVHALVNELLEQPSIGDPGPFIRTVWKRLYPSVEARLASPDCEWCHGLGWEEKTSTIQRGVFAGNPATGVTRCRCGGMPPVPRSDHGGTR